VLIWNQLFFILAVKDQPIRNQATWFGLWTIYQNVYII